MNFEDNEQMIAIKNGDKFGFGASDVLKKLAEIKAYAVILSDGGMYFEKKSCYGLAVVPYFHFDEIAEYVENVGNFSFAAFENEHAISALSEENVKDLMFFASTGEPYRQESAKGMVMMYACHDAYYNIRIIKGAEWKKLYLFGNFKGAKP